MSSLRYRALAGPSKASAATQCQKCLQRGHYSYECKASPSDRPYVARPSRTQQLLDPKLQPKLASDTPNPLLKKEGVADEQLRKAEEERGRKRRRLSNDSGSGRSASSSSVSTVSTNLSRSRSRSLSRTRRIDGMLSKLGQARRDLHGEQNSSPSRSRSRSRSTSPYRRGRKPETRRSPRRRFMSRGRSHSRSPPPRRERRISRSRSRSPVRQSIEDPRRYRSRSRERKSEKPVYRQAGLRGPAPRESSESPYSRRLRLTQAMAS